MRRALTSNRLYVSITAIGLLLLSSVAQGQTSGPLRVSEINPRYFTDDRGKAIYLTGSHTWNSWQDWPQGHQPLDYTAYLDFLVEKGHNFLKLRVWEGIDTSPLPFARPGPGT